MTRASAGTAAGLPALVAAATAAPALLDQVTASAPGRWPVSVLAVAQAVPLLWSWSRPAAAFCGVAAVTVAGNVVAAQLRHETSVWSGLSFAVAAYALSSNLPRRHAVRVAAVVAGATALGVAANAVLAEEGWRGGPHLLVWAVATAVAWGAGADARERRLEAALTAERAARLEQGRDRDLLLARVEERARIARDLHDTISHNLTQLVVRAEALRARSRQQPGWPGAELAELAAEGRRSMTELRGLLGLLHAPGPVTTARLAPAPAVTDLRDLVARARAAGSDVRLQESGDVDGLPAAVAMTAYRVVQEAVTNAQRHAPGAGVRACLEVTPAAVRLVVENAAPRAPRPSAPGPPTTRGGGLGIDGMRARVDALGGRLSAAPTAAGGFAVVARIPRTATLP